SRTPLPARRRRRSPGRRQGWRGGPVARSSGHDATATAAAATSFARLTPSAGRAPSSSASTATASPSRHRPAAAPGAGARTRRPCACAPGRRRSGRPSWCAAASRCVVRTRVPPTRRRRTGRPPSTCRCRATSPARPRSCWRPRPTRRRPPRSCVLLQRRRPVRRVLAGLVAAHPVLRVVLRRADRPPRGLRVLGDLLDHLAVHGLPVAAPRDLVALAVGVVAHDLRVCRPATARITNEVGSPQAAALATLAAASPHPLGELLAAPLRRAPPHASLPALRPRLTTPQTSHHGPPRVRTGF